MTVSLSSLEHLFFSAQHCLHQILLLDGAARWGTAPEEMDAVYNDIAEWHSKLWETLRQLNDVLQQLRVQEPALLNQWAQAHILLLEGFIKKTEDRVAASKARSEQKMWQGILEGHQNVAEENFSLISFSSEDYLEILGFPQETFQFP